MSNTQAEKKSQFAVQILEKIGAPLLSVIENAAPNISDEAGQIAQAEIMAQLLGQCASMGTMLYNTLEIQESEDRADATRVALTALVAPFIAEFYLKRKKVPAEDNLKRMLKSLEAVLMFGENFKPASDHKSRLQTIEHEVVFFDKSQPILVTMQAMVPVVNAVEEFSFGQNRRKFVESVAARLEEKAKEIAALQQEKDKLTELVIFKALADIYADCHRSETRRVLTDETARDNLSVAPIWDKFEVRVQMMQAVMGIDAPATNVATASGGVAPAVEASTPAPEIQAPPPVDAAVTPPVQAPVESTPPPSPPPVAAATSAGPMGFFKKGDDNAAATPAVAPAPVEATPTTPVTPEQSALTPASESPAVEPPVASTPPVDAAAPSVEPSTETPPSSPMGFFKKPKEEE